MDLWGIGSPRLKPQRSLLKHQPGLEIFLQKPGVPLDNNAAERVLRRPVVGRKLSYGSHSKVGAKLQGTLLSVFGTLAMGGVSLTQWLTAYLGECARIGPGKVVPDADAWLPWGFTPERRETLQAGPAGRSRGP